MPLPPFQTVVDAHVRDLHRFLSASVGPLDADDCLQETLISALRAYPRLDQAANVKAWLLTIAHRKALDLHRARRRLPVPAEAVPAGATPPEEPEDGDPELWDAVRGLPPKQRAAVTLRAVADLSHAEIGRVLDCSEEAARRSAYEGLRRLREVWTR